MLWRRATRAEVPHFLLHTPTPVASSTSLPPFSPFLSLFQNHTPSKNRHSVGKSEVFPLCSRFPGELNRDLRPHIGDIDEVAASYEYYTMEWISAQLKEGAPRRMTSFSQMGA
eukprot:365599-Chlamydomonas_euryale.AAC.6